MQLCDTTTIKKQAMMNSSRTTWLKKFYEKGPWLHYHLAKQNKTSNYENHFKNATRFSLFDVTGYQSLGPGLRLEVSFVYANDIPISGRIDRASATETGNSGTITGRVKTKTIKIGIHSFPAWRSAINGTAWCLHRVWKTGGSLTQRPKSLFTVSWPRQLGQ